MSRKSIKLTFLKTPSKLLLTILSINSLSQLKNYIEVKICLANISSLLKHDDNDKNLIVSQEVQVKLE